MPDTRNGGDAGADATMLLAYVKPGGLVSVSIDPVTEHRFGLSPPDLMTCHMCVYVTTLSRHLAHVAAPEGLGTNGTYLACRRPSTVSVFTEDEEHAAAELISHELFERTEWLAGIGSTAETHPPAANAPAE